MIGINNRIQQNNQTIFKKNPFVLLINKNTIFAIINGIITNFEKLGIIEPLKVKEQIIKSATETANMILRIDNVIAVSRSGPSEPPQGMPPGGGMY